MTENMTKKLLQLLVAMFQADHYIAIGMHTRHLHHLDPNIRLLSNMWLHQQFQLLC